MAYNPTQLNILVNEHTHKLVLDYAKDMQVPVSVLGAWIIQTHINEVARNRSAIKAFYEKKLKDRREKLNALLENQKETPVQQELPTDLSQRNLLQAFREMLQPIQNDIAKLKAELGA